MPKLGLKISQKRNVQFAVLAEGEMATGSAGGDTDDLFIQTERSANSACRAASKEP